MINPDTFANEAVAIRDIYAELEITMLEKLAKQLNQGKTLSVSDWKVQKLANLSSFSGNKELIIEQAKAINGELASILESAYIKGIKVSDATIPGSIPSPVVDFYNLNTERLNQLIKTAQIDNIQALTEFYGNVGIKYQEAINRAVNGVASGVETLDQAIKSATNQMAKDGISYVTYGNGRKVNTASYMEMVTRTTATKTSLEANTARNKEYGYELVYVSQYTGCSDTCSPWQGRIYFDDTDGFHNDTDYVSLSTAIDGGLFHPNCKHFKVPYDPDIQDIPEPIEKDIELYDKRQEQRYNERNIRKWKKVEAVSTGDDKLKASAKVNEWQKKNNNLVKSDDRLRRTYKREQVT